jgi:excisionase family DNA binding protein
MTTTTIQINWRGVPAAARLLGISDSRVKNMAKAGEIPGYRIGSNYKFDQSELEQRIATQRTTPTTKEAR